MPAISQSNFLQALGWAVINSLWQMALLWVIYQVILSILKINPDKKTKLAAVFVVTGFLWFVYTFITSWFFSPAGNPVSNAAKQLVTAETWNRLLNKIILIASVTYLLLLALPVWQFIRNYRYVQFIRHQGLGKINADWKIFVKKMSAYMGIKRIVQIWLSDWVSSPVTIGYLKPVILLPAAIISQLSTQQVEAILLHELSHIRRYDYLLNLIINFIKTILYFNPFVRLFVRNIERERENSCDEMVIQFSYRPYDYATALLLLEKTAGQRQQMLMAAAGKAGDLLHRIEHIMGIGRKKMFSVKQFAGTFTVMLLAFVIYMLQHVNKPVNPEKFSGFVITYNPYYFFNTGSGNKKTNAKPVKEEIITPNTIPLSAAINLPDAGAVLLPAEEPEYSFINYVSPLLPELAPEEEESVKETVEAAKKVLEKKEWKELEKSYAEVFNSTEKEKIHNEYLKGINSVDWEKLEGKLKLSYRDLNWEKINGQIKTSLAEIKLDSIQSVLTHTLTDLARMETWMKENKISSVPDSDVSIQCVKENEEKIKTRLHTIKITRSKKVVRI
jgi:beta-lactamase regulating signal transducer with metallopeptidase domain